MNLRLPSVNKKKPSQELEEKLKEIRIKEIERKIQAKAKLTGLPYINLKKIPIDQEALSLIPEEKAKILKVVCFFKSDQSLKIATPNPEKPGITQLKAELEKKTRLKVEIYLISEFSLEKALQLYEKIPKIRKVTKGVGITEEELKALLPKIRTFHDLDREIQNVSITDVLTLIIAAGLQARATDIHLEAEEKDIKIRFRIDGILHTVATLPQTLWPKIISRIKLLSSLKINIEDKPQSGSFIIFLTKEKIDVRVSTLPTSYGESVAMRLLLPTMALEFEDLGLRGKIYQQLKKQISQPNGLIVTTGPTGSGKTTTLYAILKKLNKPEVKIATLEDPIEYRLEGINQSQIDPSKGYTFAKGLKSVLRQDPDIVMIGEIRDKETTEIAIGAALTGHLVLSSLHTNDASGAIPRFLALGAKPFLLAPALKAAVAQRLVRRICQKCKEKITPDKKTLDNINKILSGLSEWEERKKTKGILPLYQGKGCEACQNLGYHGQIGIFEMISIEPEIEKMILSGKASEYEIKKAALKMGMITMAQDGLLKALEGITTPEEVFRVTGE
jgi:type IV pilus assembly protein PilB